VEMIGLSPALDYAECDQFQWSRVGLVSVEKSGSNLSVVEWVWP
jgi:hypothetical protein